MAGGDQLFQGGHGLEGRFVVWCLVLGVFRGDQGKALQEAVLRGRTGKSQQAEFQL